jgi:hypothetical protein
LASEAWRIPAAVRIPPQSQGEVERYHLTNAALSLADLTGANLTGVTSGGISGTLCLGLAVRAPPPTPARQIPFDL